MLHKYTSNIILLVNNYLQENGLQYKCFFVANKSSQKNDEVILEICDFHSNIDQIVWDFRLTFPKNPGNIIQAQNSIYDLTKLIHKLDEELMIIANPVPNQIALNFTIVQGAEDEQG